MPELNSPTQPNTEALSQPHKPIIHSPRTTAGKRIPQNFNIPFLKDQLAYKAQKDITGLRKRR
ncbi:TPA: hypothetical protein DCZ39_07070 [Patescibacteria group bacterium]|nr:hypothetical protein [Candidatus Gracilibacteria bacterium]